MKTSDKNVFYTVCLTILGLAFGLCSNVFAGEYIRVSPDLELYYEDKGTGAPIIFIPGWTGTTTIFKAQISHFSKNYRAISYDPRGQGRSSKTLANHNTTQHGEDLKAFMNALMLEDVILIGHSAGCYDSHAYIREYGIANIKAFVCIDAPPKGIIEQDGDWARIKDPNDLIPFNEGMNHNRPNFTRDFLAPTVTRPLTQEELNEFVDESMKTPTYVAILKWFDGIISDYTPEAQMIDGKIPVLYVLSEIEGRTKVAKTWLTKNTPNTKIEAFGDHAMFWEFPERFNAVVDAFLEKLK